MPKPKDSFIPIGETPPIMFIPYPAIQGPPKGAVYIVDDPSLYLLVRDIVMEQQAIAKNDLAKRKFYGAIMGKELEESIDPNDVFDIEGFYKGPIKIPPHEQKKESDGTPKKKKNDPKE